MEEGSRGKNGVGRAGRAGVGAGAGAGAGLGRATFVIMVVHVFIALYVMMAMAISIRGSSRTLAKSSRASWVEPVPFFNILQVLVALVDSYKTLA